MTGNEVVRKGSTEGRQVRWMIPFLSAFVAFAYCLALFSVAFALLACIGVSAFQVWRSSELCAFIFGKEQGGGQHT